MNGLGWQARHCSAACGEWVPGFAGRVAGPRQQSLPATVSLFG
jgi:hypothetical protein